jgi:hypothetical protein
MLRIFRHSYMMRISEGNLRREHLFLDGPQTWTVDLGFSQWWLHRALSCVIQQKFTSVLVAHTALSASTLPTFLLVLLAPSGIHYRPISEPGFLCKARFPCCFLDLLLTLKMETYVPLKHRWNSTRLHSITSHKTALLISKGGCIRWVTWRRPQINNYKSQNNLQMKTKVGNTVLCNTDPVPVHPVHAISVIPSYHTSYNIREDGVSCHPVSWAEGNQFQHLPWHIYLHIHQDMYLPRFVFIDFHW